MPNADMKTLTIGDTTYEIVDEEAREKEGDLSELNTQAQTDLVAAINEVADSSGVVSVNGMTGTVVLTAADVGAATTGALTDEATARTAADAQLQGQITALGNGAPTVVDAKADMTEHDKIYILSSDGKWYYYSSTASDWLVGGTYGGAVTDSTLTQEDVPADSKAVGDALALKADDSDVTALDTRVTSAEDDIATLQADLAGLVPVNLADGTTITSGKYIKYDTGVVTNSSIMRATDYIDISGCEKIMYMRIFSTSGTVTQGIAFYNESKTYISGIICMRNQSEGHMELVEGDVPENAVYVRLTLMQGYDPVVYDKEDYDNNLQNRLTAIETEMSGIESDVQDMIDGIEHEVDEVNGYLAYISKDGYIQLDASKWALGGWQSYASTNSNSFQVRYTEPISFDRDIYIIASEGFYITYFIEGGSSGNACVLRLPANTNAKIYVRRISQDTSETAVVSEWATKHKISTAIAPIEANKLTFTDVTMFPRIGIGGDSYAAGVSSNVNLSWGKCLQRQSGVQVDVYAQSGQSVMEWNTNQSKGLPALLAGEECGLYWLHHGINGTSSDSAIGTPADMSASPHPNTFYGQYVEAIEQIKDTFPNAKIVMATVVGSSYNNYQALHYTKANTAIRAIAEYCEVPCIEIIEDDFFKLPWYSDYNYSNHPTAMQVAGMAMAYRRLLSKCIFDNPTYFKDYGL